VIGVAVYDEGIRHGLGASLAMAVLLLLLGVAVYQLAKAEPDAPLPAGP